MLRKPIPTLPRIFGRRDEPIIESAVDLDVYKLFMGQYIRAKHGKIKVRFALLLRTKNGRLADHIDVSQLKEELRHCQTLRISSAERQYLGGMFQYTPGKVLFQHDYLEFLSREIRLPDPHVETRNGELIVEVEDDWEMVTYWETLVLAIVNELYFRDLIRGYGRFERDALFAQGLVGLKEKIRHLKELRSKFLFTFSEFGTRRRFCREWQRIINAYMAEEIGEDWEEGFVDGRPFYRGTSNVRFAMDCSVTAMGTMAHELLMVQAAVAGGISDQALFESHGKVIDEWLAFYGKGLSLILPDTFGSAHTFRTMTKAQAEEISGFRQDSGIPVDFLEKEEAFFKKHGVDPSEKMGVPSDGIHIPDGLTAPLEQFAEKVGGPKGRLGLSAGIGTNFTNDFPGLKALPLVMKPVSANGFEAVKLADDEGKRRQGPEVDRYVRVFGCGECIHTEPVY